MSTPVFITFKDTMINVGDISWSQVDSVMRYYDPDKPWSMTINFRGVSQFIRFNFETQDEAQAAYQYLRELMETALFRSAR